MQTRIEYISEDFTKGSALYVLKVFCYIVGDDKIQFVNIDGRKYSATNNEIKEIASDVGPTEPLKEFHILFHHNHEWKSGSCNILWIEVITQNNYMARFMLQLPNLKYHALEVL